MEPPVPPSDSDCCNSGCNPCILDVYEAQLKKYNEYCKRNGNHLDSETQINALSLTSYTIFVLAEREEIAPDVFLLKFVYGDTKSKPPNCFKYKPGQYILSRVKDYDGEFTRAYTPIPCFSNDKLGFSILVRCYNIGRMSNFFQKLQIGYKTSWRGPYGDFIINYNYKYLLFIAQGTGIAPIFAVINEIIHNDECESFVKLFFCCRNCDDILLRDQLYELCDYWNFSYEIFLSNSDNFVKKYNETIHTNKLTTTALKNYIENKIGQLQINICGSESFNKSIKSQIINLGIESSHIYSF